LILEPPVYRNSCPQGRSESEIAGRISINSNKQPIRIDYPVIHQRPVLGELSNGVNSLCEASVKECESFSLIFPFSD